MTPDPTLIEQVARIQVWLDGGCNSWGAPAPDIRAVLATLQGSAALPIPMLLYCPQCGQAHVDELDERTPDWTNPPHRSHLCHDCGCIWRPADVPTTGVAAIETQGKADTWTAERGNAESAMRATTPTAPDNMGPQGEDHPFNPTNDPDAPVQDDDAERLAQFLRDHHIWCTAHDGRFERAAQLIDRLSRLSPAPETDQQEEGVPASPSGCQPSASNLRFSRSGIPNAEDSHG